MITGLKRTTFEQKNLSSVCLESSSEKQHIDKSIETDSGSNTHLGLTGDRVCGCC